MNYRKIDGCAFNKVEPLNIREVGVIGQTKPGTIVDGKEVHESFVGFQRENLIDMDDKKGKQIKFVSYEIKVPRKG